MTCPAHVGIRRLAGMLAVLSLLVLAWPAGLSAGPRAATKLDPHLLKELAAAPGGRDSFLVFLRDSADLRTAPAIPERVDRVTYVYQTLRATAERSQADLRADLAAWGVPYHPFFIVNAIQVTGDEALARRLAARPEVARVVADPSFNGLDDPPPGPAGPPAADGVEWNIARLQAPAVWAMGYTGQGIVVGSADTGVDYTHPALVGQYRGNLGGGNFDHNYNWHDTFGEYAYPYDPNGHGTHTTGTMVGSDDPAHPISATNAIGMAPGAQWIACKLNSGGTWKASKYIECWEWFMAPTDLNGQNPRPDLAAHIINNSWSCPGSEGCDMDTLLPAAQSLYAAGIAIAKSGGNSGPTCNTITNPGQYEEILATAAFAQGDTIASFSSRGPVTYRGRTRVKPDIAAPGSGIRSSTPGGGYGNMSGTSMASPHTAGLIALLWSARPDLIGNLDTTYQIVKSSAEPKVDLQCPPNGPGGRPNNVWGWGILNAYNAVQAARSGGIGILEGTTYDSAFNPLAGTQVKIVRADNGLGRTLFSGPTGFYSSTLLSATYLVTATHYGYLPATASVTVPSGTVTLLDLVLDGAASWTLSGTVTDQGSGAPLRATLTLVGTPVQATTDPASGFYSTTVAEGAYTLRAESPGYVPQERAITVGGNLVVNFALLPEATYYVRDNTAPCGPTFAWIDITGSGQAWNLGDDAYQYVSFGGTFPFYGTGYGGAYLGSNGQIVLGTSAGAGYPGGNTVPSTFPPNNAIYAFWDDLNPAGGSQGTIYTQLVDGRLFVIEYYRVQHFPSGSPETFEAILDLDSGAITLQYLQVSDSRWTTVGIENASGTTGFSYAFHDPTVPSDGLAIAFYPVRGEHPAEQGLGLLAGTVVASGTLVPIGGAEVVAEAWSGGFFTTTSGPTGAYTLPLCADLYTVTAMADGYYPADPVATAVYSGAVAVQDFFLEPIPQCQPVYGVDFIWQPPTPTVGQVVTFTGLVTARTWLTETVGNCYGAVGTSLALDAAGWPRISYQYLVGQDLQYASYNGTDWITETVDSSIGPFTSLALDNAGRPHISYNTDSPTYNLKHAYYDGFSWHLEIVDRGVNSSLALDSDGLPHIAYQRGCGPKYAQYNGTEWQTETVDCANIDGWDISLALDPQGHPCISYFNSGRGLQYGWYTGSTWITTVVDSNPHAGPFNSLALDSAGLPHIAYQLNTPSFDLKYAHFDGVSWQIETVDSAGWTGWFASLALDANDHPHISYYTEWPIYSLKYAHHDGSAWIIETADGSYYVGQYSSVAVDADGNPHISYTDGTSYRLRYAHRVQGPTPPITYTWNLGDGTYLTGEVVTHTYAQPGIYMVALTATNCVTATASVLHAVTVVSPPCDGVHDADFSWQPLTPTVSQVVTFTAGAGGTPPITYTWNFGDGSSLVVGPLSTVTHTYAQPGTYTVVLTATNCLMATAGAAHVLIVAGPPAGPSMVYLPIVLKGRTLP